MKFRISLYLFLCVGQLFAQKVLFTTELKQIPNLITKNRFVKAEQIIVQEALKHPDNRAVDYLRAATLSMNLYVHADQLEFEERLPEYLSLLDKIEDLPDSEPWRNVFLGELKVALAILHAKFNNRLKGFWQFNQAYGLLEDNLENFPEFAPTKMSFGVLQAALGSLPADYQAIASLIGLSGDLGKGMQMLNQAYWRVTADDETRFLQNYYGFIYAFVNFQLFDSHEISPNSLGLEFGNDGFIIYLQALMEYTDGNGERAVVLLQNRTLYPNEKPFYYLDYLLGKYALAFEPEAARASLEAFLKRPNNTAYKKSAYRYLAWYYILKSDKDEVEALRSKILNEGNTDLGSDKQALLEAKAGFNPVLVKGRVYFDGGLYSKALSALNAQNVMECCKSPNEQVEYFYRKGRVYQEMEKKGEAIENFKLATNIPNATSSYGLANSYLQLGVLYAEAESKEKAKVALKQVSKYTGFPFYEGLHQKAKAALSQL